MVDNVFIEFDGMLGDKLNWVVHCPVCGFPENLDISITGNWGCEACGSDFFIYNVRIVSEELLGNQPRRQRIDNLVQ